MYENKYLRERRRQDEFDEDIYSEGYLEEEDAEGWAQGWMLGYNEAEEE